MSWTGLLTGLVAGLAVAFAVDEYRRVAAGRLLRFVTRAQAIRRIVGSLLVALLMVLVYAGLERIDPYARPGLFVTIWCAAVPVVLVVLWLGLRDLRELRAHQARERLRVLDSGGQGKQGPGSGGGRETRKGGEDGGLRGPGAD